MAQPTTRGRAFEQAYLRPVIRRFKKVMGIGRISAVAARVDRLAAIEPRVGQIEALQPRIDALERRIEELESLYREQVGLQYLHLAAAATSAPSDAPFSQRRAK